MSVALTGFKELLRLDSLAKSRTSQPLQIEEPDWKGVAFEVAGKQFVAPIGEISEVLSVPSLLTQVPLTKPWLVGVANVRGDLLPIADLAKFLNLNSRAAQQSRRKILVINLKDRMVGLLVDNVINIKNFTRDQYAANNLPIDSPFLPYNHGQFIQDQKVWPIFMPSLLIQNPRFDDASI